MSVSEAPRCRHIKVNGTQCGSPALHKKNFCFYHQGKRPKRIDCYYKPDEYATGEITLPYFEDAHSIQSVIRETVHMVLQKRLGEKTASVVLYALQIASSNLQRMDLEKPQPALVVTDVEQQTVWHIPIAALIKGEAAREAEGPADPDVEAIPANFSTETSADGNKETDRKETDCNEIDRDEDNSDLLPGTIQACCQPGPQTRNSRSTRQRKQYVI